MIHWPALGLLFGHFLLAFAGAMGFPVIYSLLTDRADLAALTPALVCTALCGAALRLGCRGGNRELNQREGLLLVVVTWLGASFFGCLPYAFSPYFDSFTDAWFESVSGFTTTGATVLDDVEALSNPIQLWRCFSHWLGGMGIVLLVVAILPLVGHGGMHLYRAEFSGAKSAKLKPRIAETAAALWKIYLALTLAEYGVLLYAGLSHFEALAHAFSTMGTGGFSTRNASIAGFESPLVEYVVIVFMLLAGISLIQQYRLWVEREPGGVLRDFEVRLYLILIGGASALIGGILYFGRGYELEPALRGALFQVASITTTTGFVTDDFEAWHPLPQLILLALMFVGGCTGSTAGGMKIARLALLGRVVDREFKRIVERRGVFAIRVGGGVVPEAAIQGLLNLVYLAFVVNFFSCLALAALGVDVLTSIAAVAASMFNIGPGFGSVGPLENYAGLPALAKWVLSFDMIAGRLEFYTILVILTPWFWRK